MSASSSRDELGRVRDYIPRFADAELEERLRATGAVLIEGPRGCGKTETALRAASSVVRLDRDPAARRAGILNPALLLAGEPPRLVDEWQPWRTSGTKCEATSTTTPTSPAATS